MASNSTGIDSGNNSNNEKIAESVGTNEGLKTQDNCSVDKTDKEGYTPLHRMYTKRSNSDEKDVEMVEMLIALGADVHTKANNGSTIFHSAVKNNKALKLLECLTQLPSKVGEHGEPQENKDKTFNFRDDVNCMDNEGLTPLHLIVKKENREYSNAERREKVDADIKTVLKLLMSLGADVNIKIEASGYTALLLAADKLDVAAVEILIRGGASVNVMTPENQNALHLILTKNPYRENAFCNAIAKLLIDNGIDMDVVYSGETPLHMALGRNEEITRYLIQKGASVNMENKKGETVLHCAIENNQYDIVKLLLKQ